MKIQDTRYKIQSQAGVVSLLTTVILSLLLSVIVTSAVTLSVGELRQSENGDQAVKAYFAAEAGVEDALLAVKADLASPPHTVVPKNSCGSPTQVSPTNPNVEYTCQTIRTTVNEMTGLLGVDQATQTGPITGFTNLVVNWHQFGSDPDVVGLPYSPPSNYTARDSWNYPAAMELTSLSYNPSAVQPACPNGCPGGIGIKSTVVKPAAGTGTGSISTKSQDGQCKSANVTATSGYNCTINLSGFNPSLTYILRLRPRYTGSHYSMQPKDSVGAPVAVASQAAIIDVTAKAGSVFRRVQVQVPLNAGAASGLDYVLFSDTDICKDFNVSGNTAAGFCAP